MIKSPTWLGDEVPQYLSSFPCCIPYNPQEPPFIDIGGGAAADGEAETKQIKQSISDALVRVHIR